MASTQSMSKEFLELIRSIGEAKSKQEEDKIILSELKVLRTRLGEKDVPRRKMREYLIRMLYCEMLGHDASFAHIQAVNMTQASGLPEKRIGYLAVGLVLHEDHELIILLVNTIQRDLKSSNYLEVCAALGAVCKLMNAETIPAVLPQVVELLSHSQELVRKKAVMALHRFWTRAPGAVAHLQDKFRRALCDRDPSVMNAALCIFLDQAREDPVPYKDLVPSFVSILKQITEHRLSREYDYHRIPACWIQIRILKVLALLGADDQRTSEGMYEILHEVMKRADTGINAGYAIVYETVRTITAIYPNTQLLEAAASSISAFITSENQNLRYLGITALAAIVGVDRKYAAEHQMVVIECMEDPDETLKRKTLDLLCKITTPANVTVIVDKLTAWVFFFFFFFFVFWGFFFGWLVGWFFFFFCFFFFFFII
jgi:AP-4 complex subunit epsilon-1